MLSMLKLQKAIAKFFFAVTPALLVGTAVALIFQDLGIGLIVLGAGTAFGYEILSENSSNQFRKDK